MNFSPITDDLFIGTTPATQDYQRLRELGIRLVLNMRIERRPFPDLHDPPINVLWLPTFDSPLIPIPIPTLMRGAQAALAAIQQGGKVYVHCAFGRHRAVAMGSAILIAQGHEPQSAMQLIKSQRSFADPEIFYIRRRILKFASEWGVK